MAKTNPEQKLRKLKLLEEKKRLITGLPHLYGMKFYPWMREYFDSQNKINLICSANQIGKSSINIRKCIDWATNKEKWKILWPHLENPRQFWYLYPSSYVATIEVEKKWIPEFLPRAEFKDDPVYGWRIDYRSKYVQAVHFNSGVSIYLKTYSQDPQDLQSGSVAATFTDEELPQELWSELQARLFATNGHFHAVFTPTLGQEFWREALEVRGYKERFPEALKIQVSMYDCLLYEDGSKSFWSAERIEQIKRGCKSEAEIQRRVYGRFVLDSGLKYPGFTPDKNLVEPVPIPPDWLVYCGVDSGSGGKFNHPASVSFVAVSPDFRKGYVFKGRRFDGITTTAADLVQFVMEMSQDVKNTIVGVYYDFAAADLKEIAMRMGANWIPAEKSHLIGEQVLNVGFKSQMLNIFNIEELAPLAGELKSLKISTNKNNAADDFIDSMRYACTRIPWDWSAINEIKPIAARQKSEVEIRREYFMSPQKDEETIERDFEEYNDLIGGLF